MPPEQPDRTMTCREFVDFVDDYVEQRLAAPVRSTFQTHIDKCPQCGDYLTTYEQTIRLTRSLCSGTGDGPIPGDVPEALVQAILDARKRG